MCNFSSLPHPSVGLGDSQSGIFVREIASCLDTVCKHVVSIVLYVAELSETVALVVRRFISFCKSYLKGALGAPDLRSAADPGADRTGDSTGGRAHFYRGDNTVGQIVAVPHIQEQNVEVIKVILQEQCQQIRFFF